MREVREVHSPRETYEFGKELGERAVPGEIYGFYGDLGAGKTVFIQGFAAGLGVTEDVVSPTFTILREYGSGRIPMYHFDVYRIDDPDELFEVGFDEYLYGTGVSLIEWAELVGELLPEGIVRVTIGKDFPKGAEYRKITVEREEKRNDDARH